MQALHMELQMSAEDAEQLAHLKAVANTLSEDTAFLSQSLITAEASVATAKAAVANLRMQNAYLSLNAREARAYMCCRACRHSWLAYQYISHVSGSRSQQKHDSTLSKLVGKRCC